jgi:drug/metabolite transporter (DMT)-like permease
VPVGELSALAAAASWAVGSLLFAGIGRKVSPGAMNLGKCCAAAILLSLACLALAPSAGPAAWPLSAALLLALSGVVGLTMGDTAYFGAIVTLGVPRAILLLSASPVFAALGGALFLDERVGGREVLGIGLTLAGIALVVTGRLAAPPGVSASSPEAGRDRVRRGVALGLVAAFGQAAGSLLSRRAMALGIDPLAASAGRLVAGAACLLIGAAIAGRAGPWLRELRAGFAWAKVSGASLIGTCGGIWLGQIGIARCSSTGVASTLLATSPLFALPLAHATGAERITRRGAIGTLVALGGVVLLSLRKG